MKVINATHKIIVESANTTLQHTDICHEQYPKVNLIFLFISFFKLFSKRYRNKFFMLPRTTARY